MQRPMNHRLRFVLALLMCQLLLGQQLALAHMIGHISENTQAHTQVHAGALPTSAQGQDVEHGAADGLLHLCTNCLGFVGLDTLLSGATLAAYAAAGWTAPADYRVPPAPAVSRPSPFLSRAPPSSPR